MIRAFASRISGVFRRNRAEREFAQEVDAHLDLLVKDFVRRGMPEEEARYAARRQFGGIAQLKEVRRSTSGFPRIETFVRDVQLAVRLLWNAPVFTLTALVTLALGIGANAAIFSVVDTVLLKPLHAPDAERMVRFLRTYPGGSAPWGSPQEVLLWQNETGVFEDVSAHRLELMNLSGGMDAEQIPVARVTAGFFRLFGAKVLRGRTFDATEDRPNGGRVAVLSHGVWTRQFASDARVVGQAILVSGVSYIVIGILGPGFDSEQFDQRPDVYLPFQIDADSTEGGCYCLVSGRLKPGVSLDTARAQLKITAERYRTAFPTRLGPREGYGVHPLREAMVGDVRSSLLILSGAVGFVLLIACANVASLLLVRAAGRKREIAIRAAVGAGRGRVIRQLLTESVVLSLAGGALGLALGFAGIRGLLALYPANPLAATLNPVNLPRIGEQGAGIALDWRVVLFTIIVSLGTGVLFGLIPALQASRADLSAVLKDGGRLGGGLRENKTRSLLAVGEIALALVLLVGAALLIRTSIALRAVDPGFDARNALMMQMSLAGERFEKTSEIETLVREGVRSVRSVPGVEAVAASCCVPLENVWSLTFEVVGWPLEGPFHGRAGWTFVSPEYFDALRIPVVRGRGFTEPDGAGAPGVVIINQAMARQFWPTGDPLNDRLIIGKAVRPEYAKDGARQIVGIVADIRDVGLNEEPRPAMYVPIAQLPDAINALNLRLLPIAWIVRESGEPMSLRSSLKNALQTATGLPVARVRSMEEVAAQSTARTQFHTLLMTIFGFCALILAAVGIYGLMAFSVAQRSREIGIRIALGAEPRAARNMVVSQGMQLAVAGVVVGLAASLGLARMVAGFLFGVKPWDPLVFAAVPAILMAVASLAVWIPAQRATRIDPVDALRCE